MKKRFAIILIALLLGGNLVPATLAADKTPIFTDSGTTDTSMNTDAGISATADGSTNTDSLENNLSMPLQVTPSVLTVSPSAITLTSFDEPYPTDAVAFPLGASPEELADWFADVVTGFTGYDALGNAYDLMPSTWSLETVDTSTTGVYYASAALDLGEDYILADGVSLPKQLCAVSIQTPGEPDINCFVSGRGFLHFPWVLSAGQQEQLDAFAVWLRQDSGEWTKLSDNFLFISDSLRLSQRIFENGSTYNLKVTYPGGQTGVLTFQYDEELQIINYSGGDRDGGDVTGNGSGAGSQPPPTSPPAPNDSQTDGDYNTNNSTPVQLNSSPISNETLAESVSVPEESLEALISVFSELLLKPTPVFNELQDKQNFLPDEVQPKQAPVSDKSDSTTPAAPTELASVYSNASFFHESENASAMLGTETYVMNPVPSITDIQPEAVTKSQAPAPTVQESYSPWQTVISGLRLRDLCTDEESVVFGSGDLTVSIPSKLLLALNLSDSDTLSVRLTQPESNRIMLAVEVFGKSVTELSGTVLRLRYTPQRRNTEITVRNEGDEQIMDAAFDGEFLRFTANTAGTYTIVEASTKAQEPQKGVSPFFLLSATLILAAGGITFLRSKRHG